MQKTMALLTPARSGYIKVNKNEFDRKVSNGIDGSKINNRITNLSNSTKVNNSFGTGFFTSKASLIFTQLKKAFIKASILYYFYQKNHIQIVTDVSYYIIGDILG